MPTHHHRSASRVGMLLFSLLLTSLFSAQAAAPKEAPMIRGSVVDSETGQPVPARVTIRKVSTGEWFFANPATPQGRTVHYKKERGGRVEMHTSVSAAPFVVTASPGAYRFTLEQGPKASRSCKGYQSRSRTWKSPFPSNGGFG